MDRVSPGDLAGPPSDAGPLGFFAPLFEFNAGSLESTSPLTPRREKTPRKAWLSIAGRSLLPSILCHAGVNLLVVFGLSRLPGWGAPAADGTFFQPLVLGLLVLSLAILTIGVRQLRREFRRVAAVAA